MAISGTRSSYDDPSFSIIREERFLSVQSLSASLSDFAIFRCRNRCIVKTVVVHCASLPSAITTWSLQVMRGASTIAAKTVSSFSVVGDLSAVITLTGSNTLETITDSINLELNSTEKGKFHVIYEYQLLPPPSI